ncbi:MAG: hypothetical protein JWM02_1324 [Frankiales bacterium]|nr:hypothetical protein [Frankiales bacterium]
MESLVELSATRVRAAASTTRAHQQMIRDLEGAATPATPNAALYKPLVLHAVDSLPPLLRVYLFNLTTHTSERQMGAFRIQITLNSGKQPAHFDWSNGAFVVLAGYSQSLGVYALWDAGVYDIGDGIAFSRGCQVLDSTLYSAMTKGLAEQERRMRNSGLRETVVAATAGNLERALELRWQRTVDRLIADTTT